MIRTRHPRDKSGQGPLVITLAAAGQTSTPAVGVLLLVLYNIEFTDRLLKPATISSHTISNI